MIGRIPSGEPPPWAARAGRPAAARPPLALAAVPMSLPVTIIIVIILSQGLAGRLVQRRH
jgi:hypothetical protein